jgi:hypothetical protein
MIMAGSFAIRQSKNSGSKQMAKARHSVFSQRASVAG